MKGLKLVGLILGIIFLLLGLSYFGLKAMANRPFAAAAAQLPQLKRDIVAAGMPLTMDDLFAQKPVDESENAAEEYNALFKLYDKLDSGAKKGTESWVWRLEFGTPEEKKQVFAEADKFGPFINLTHQAATKSQLRFKRDWSLGTNLLFPEYAQMKSAIKVLAFHAFVEARRGKIDSALQDIETSYRLCSHLGTEPTMIAMLVRIACLAITDYGVVNIVPEAAKNPTTLARLTDIVKKGHPPIDAVWTWKGEFTGGLTYLDQAARMKESWAEIFKQWQLIDSNQSIFNPAVPPLATKETVTAGFKARFLEGYLEAKRKYDKSKNYADCYTSLDTFSVNAQAKHDPSYLYIEMVMPVFGQASESVARAGAYGDMVLAVLDVAKFKSRTGRLPKTLAEAEVFTPDIFGNGPLSYRIEGDRAVIYSFGRNHTDEGGEIGSGNDTVMCYPPYFKPRRP